MGALVHGRESVSSPNLRSWLRHADEALARAGDLSTPDAADRVSQLNALLQLEHLRSYPMVAAAEREGRLKLHAFWFDIANAEVLAHDPAQGKFVALDEAQAARLSS
jgi:carbonic anhydrase